MSHPDRSRVWQRGRLRRGRCRRRRIASSCVRRCVVGGLTPSIGLLDGGACPSRAARSSAWCGRARARFATAMAELDVDAPRHRGVSVTPASAGIVFGVLTADGDVDLDALSRARRARGPARDRVPPRVRRGPRPGPRARRPDRSRRDARAHERPGARRRSKGRRSSAGWLSAPRVGSRSCPAAASGRRTSLRVVLEATGMRAVHLGPQMRVADRSGASNPRDLVRRAGRRASSITPRSTARRSEPLARRGPRGYTGLGSDRRRYITDDRRRSRISSSRCWLGTSSRVCTSVADLRVLAPNPPWRAV